VSEPRTIEIDGFTYTIGRLPPRRALKLENRLLRALGPAVAQLVTAIPLKDGKPDLAKLDLGALGGALQGLMAQLTPEEQDVIMAELLSTVIVSTPEGKGGAVMPLFDAHFDGRLHAVFKLCWAALEENFGGFIAPLVAAARTAGAAILSRASTTSPSSGPSGG
jgi:hypothetical protein